MRVANENILTFNGAVVSGNLAISRNFKPIWLGHIVNYSIQLTFTGTPAGSFKLQVSDDEGRPNAASEAEQSAGVTNWTDMDNSTFVVAGPGNVMWNIRNSGTEWVRCVFTATGAGTTPVLTVARCKVKGA